MALAGEIIRGGDVPGSLIPYTPTLTGASSATWTQGASVITANYIRAGDWVEVWADIVLGAGVSITGAIGAQALCISLPVAAHASLITPTPVGVGMVIDTGTGAYPLTCMLQDANRFFGRYPGGAGTANVLAANTFTFASTDRIGWNVSYQAA